MLDSLDKQILQELEYDSRQSNASIAHKIKSNKTIVNYRIQRLQSKGVITGYRYISNQIALGKLSFGLLIRFKDLSLEKEEELIIKLKKMNSISWISYIDGKWDIILVIIEKDIESFNKALEKIFLECGEKIKEYNFYIEYEGGISNHDYLYDTSKYPPVKYCSGQIVEIKKIESQVYDILKKEPKISLLEIAKKLDKTYDTIKSKFNYLKSKNILLRCCPIINIKTLGYNDYLCLFNTQPSQEKLKRLVELCIKHPNIVRYSKCLGHFNLILNIHCKNNLELKKILYTIRNRFPELINFYEIIPLIQ